VAVPKSMPKRTGVRPTAGTRSRLTASAKKASMWPAVSGGGFMVAGCGKRSMVRAVRLATFGELDTADG
jgi:hypothetical protein